VRRDPHPPLDETVSVHRVCPISTGPGHCAGLAPRPTLEVHRKGNARERITPRWPIAGPSSIARQAMWSSPMCRCWSIRRRFGRKRMSARSGDRVRATAVHTTLWLLAVLGRAVRST
jgi:hypothetical protein